MFCIILKQLVKYWISNEEMSYSSGVSYCSSESSSFPVPFVQFNKEEKLFFGNLLSPSRFWTGYSSTDPIHVENLAYYKNNKNDSTISSTENINFFVSNNEIYVSDLNTRAYAICVIYKFGFLFQDLQFPATISTSGYDRIDEFKKSLFTLPTDQSGRSTASEDRLLYLKCIKLSRFFIKIQMDKLNVEIFTKISNKWSLKMFMIFMIFSLSSLKFNFKVLLPTNGTERVCRPYILKYSVSYFRV